MSYISPDYSPDKVCHRYVKLAMSGLFEFVEFDANSKTIRQDTIDFLKIPKAVSEKAIQLQCMSFPWVEWHKDQV